MAGKDTEYEKFVRDITEALLRAEGLTVKVEHDKQVQGTACSHQIDVYWEYRLGGVLHRVIINCKRYKDTVEKTDVLTLKGVLDDMPGVRGLIATTVGFQRGAVDYAKQHGIGLKVIRPPKDEDWEGRFRSVVLNVDLRMPQLTGCHFALNLDWVKANIPGDPNALAGEFTAHGHSTKVRDSKTGSVEDFNALFNRAVAENPTDGLEGHGVLRWEDARLERPGEPALRLDSIEFRWRFDVLSSVIEVQSDPAAIVRDAIAGTLLFVDPDGTVRGDVEEERG